MDLEKSRHSPPIHHRLSRIDERFNPQVQADCQDEQATRRKRKMPPVPLISMARNRPRDHRSRSISPWRSPLLGFEAQIEIIDADEATYHRRICRYLIWYSAVTTMLLLAGFFWLGPVYIEYSMLNDSLTQRMESGRGWFGAKMRAEFDDMIQQSELDDRLLPSAEEKDRRLIIVGDVHGCIEEINALLDHVSFHPAKDHLIFTGNLIFHGPDSSAVVELAMRHNASCVRGNDEDRVLLLHRDLFSHPLTAVNSNTSSTENEYSRQNLHQQYHRPAALSSSLTKSPSQSLLRQQTSAHRILAASLSAAQIRYLYSCPLILTTSRLPSSPHQLAIVHAGLTPGIPLNQQDPSSILTIRSIDLNSFIPSPHRAPFSPLASTAGDNARSSSWSGRGRPRAPVPWWKLWDRWQARRARDERLAVVYGHDEEVGVTRGTWTWGLDGGCWRGGELAAAVVGWKGIRVERVRCRDRRPREMEQLGAG